MNLPMDGVHHVPSLWAWARCALRAGPDGRHSTSLPICGLAKAPSNTKSRSVSSLSTSSLGGSVNLARDKHMRGSLPAAAGVFKHMVTWRGRRRLCDRIFGVDPGGTLLTLRLLVED